MQVPIVRGYERNNSVGAHLDFISSLDSRRSEVDSSRVVELVRTRCSVDTARSGEATRIKRNVLSEYRAGVACRLKCQSSYPL